jgi:hypothetical protein
MPLNTRASEPKVPIDWTKPVLRRLTDSEEPEPIRNATPEEIEASRVAGGYIEVDGLGTCYVEE